MKDTKKARLLRWCNSLGRPFNSVEVRDFGIRNFYASADRTMREFAAKGWVRRIPTDECKKMGLIKKGQADLAWYTS